MKRITLLNLLCLFILNTGFSQNLVLNSDLEEYMDCPAENGDFFATNWEIVGGTCDYFHTCSDNSQAVFPVGVPENFVGYQYPLSGEAYVGAVSYVDLLGAPNVREYFAAKLSSPLEMGTTYYISIMVSLADFSSHACNNLGIKFIDESQLNGPVNNNPVMDNTAHIYREEFITDTMGWVMLKGTFEAFFPFEYMAIGNFFDDANTDTLFLMETYAGGSSVFAYHYYDNACVSSDSTDCFPVIDSNVELETIEQIQLHPNPTTGKVFFKNIDGVANIKINDLLGRTVLAVPVQKEIDIAELHTGAYFVQFEDANGGVMKTAKLIKQ